MADLSRAEALLEELRAASYGAALADRDEVQAYAASQGFQGELEWWVPGLGDCKDWYREV